MSLIDLITRPKAPPAPPLELMAELSSLRAENASLRTENASLRQDRTNDQDRIAQLEKDAAVAQKIIARLNAKITELTAKAKTNSATSSKPPSSDGLAKAPPKPKNSREKSDKKTGGQPGHEGSNLPFKAILGPDDQIIDHKPALCSCGKDLCGEASTIAEIRQVHDLPPPPQIYVQQHQVHKVKCSGCGAVSRGEFPSEATGYVCYGPIISASLIYLAAHQYIPLERLADTMRQLFGVKLSQGTIVNKLIEFSQRVEEPVSRIFDLLVKQFLLHADETGMRAKGKLHWLHVIATEFLTYYQLHDKRGGDAIKELGMMELFHGLLVHDFWKAYFDLDDITHSMCVAHLLRELKNAHQNFAQPWAEAMIQLLVEAHNEAKKARAAGDTGISALVLDSFRRRYDAIVAQGRRENDISPELEDIPTGKRGAPQSKPVNLLARFEAFKSEIFRFAEDLRVPFDNNQAERDLRMAKVRQKVSGTFRNVEIGKHFFTGKAYISTAVKQGQGAYGAILSAFKGNPFMPAAGPPAVAPLT